MQVLYIDVDLVGRGDYEEPGEEVHLTAIHNVDEHLKTKHRELTQW